ncbi:MAG: hypothetical protein GY913_33395 [Proteobacteria bacterium]|nr:hypothetical protein [Pseudomonadota bacterium]MCP4921822.1 hypothetical protein [Pseudomonadota bacterium]
MLLLALACSDYDLNPEEDNTEPFVYDTAPPCPPGMDCTEDTEVEPEDTDPPELVYCDEQYFPALALDLVDECNNEPTTGTWDPVIEWTSSAPGSAYTTPAIGNLTDDNGDGVIDEDDTPDVIVGNSSGTYWALSGDNGSSLWSTADSMGSEPMSAAIGDVDGDGKPDVVGAGASGIAAWSGEDGSLIWKTSAYSGGNSPQCGAVGLHDLEGDGDVEVIIGNAIYDGSTGSLIAQGAYGSGAGHGWAAPMGVAADIDRDGDLEVVVGNAIYDENGTAEWANGQSDGFVAVGQFDSDKYGEIVVAHTGSLRLQDHDGTVLWTKNGLTGSTIGPPTVADFDGDGEPEIGVAGNGVYMVVEGSDGSTLWSNAVQDFSSGFTGSAVFDFEGDGAAEVVYADEVSVWVYDGATGAVKMQENAHSSATCSEYPAIADVDNDGHAEIVYTSSAYGSPSYSGVTVIGDADNSWQQGRPVWNQHAYFITNVDDDSTIPTSQDTNWATYNNFRSGDVLAGTGGVQPDLVVSLDYVCDTECDRGKLWAWARVGNQGHEDVVDPFDVVLSVITPEGEKAIATETITHPVPSGEMLDSISFEVAGLEGWTIYDVRVAIDGGNGEDGAIVECNEANDEDSWGTGVCL